MVVWYFGLKIGCDVLGGIFVNILMDVMIVFEVVVNWVIEDGGDDIGVIIFIDFIY